MLQRRVISDEDPVLLRCLGNLRYRVKPEPHHADAPHQEVTLLGARHTHGDVGFAVIERRAPRHAGDGQRNVGMLGTEADCFWSNQMGGDGWWRADLDGGGQAGDGALRIPPDRLDILLHAGHQLGNRPAIGRERRGARPAVDQAKVKRALQRGDAPADGGMVHAKLARRRRERAGPRQRGKMKKVLPIDHLCIIAQIW